MRKLIELTPAEKLAREHFMKTQKAWAELYEEDNGSKSPGNLPNWYDEELYKRGQQYFKENRAGILYSNYMGLVTFLAEPRGINILKFSGRSESAKAAKQRYVSILVHTLSWYNYDLTPGSKSFKSLARVRHIHRLASRAMHSRNKPGITHGDMARTAFGFMGFMLCRPDLIPVRIPKDEELKAFVHFWAVVCHMVGVKEEYNICLLPLDALIIYCQMMVRYIWLPLIQIQNSDFEEMVKAITVGLKYYLIEVDFDVDLFSAKRLLLVPGYQFNMKKKQKLHCRSILSQEDVDELNESARPVLDPCEGLYYTVDIPIIEVVKDEGSISVEEAFYLQMPLLSRMELKPGERVKVRMVNYEEEWQSCLNNSKYDELSTIAKLGVLRKDFVNGLCDNFVGRFFSERVLSLAIVGMKSANKRLKIPITKDNNWIKEAL